MKRLVRSAFALLLVSACGGGSKDGDTTPAATTETGGGDQTPAAGGETAAAGEPAGETPATPAGPTAEAQVAEGQSVWGDSCAGCHGDGGEGKGKKNPSVVGEKSLAKYKTAAELEAYIKEKMPKDDPGTLSDDQAWAVTAWLVSKNGKLGDAALTEESAASVSIH
jgi:cytochrome c